MTHIRKTYRQVAREVGRKYLAGLAGQDADRVPYRLTPNQQELLECIADALAECAAPAGPETTEPDEEMVPHTFSPRSDGDIWCEDCEYHRDHAIHAAPETVTPPALKVREAKPRLYRGDQESEASE